MWDAHADVECYSIWCMLNGSAYKTCLWNGSTKRLWCLRAASSCWKCIFQMHHSRTLVSYKVTVWLIVNGCWNVDVANINQMFYLYFEVQSGLGNFKLKIVSSRCLLLLHPWWESLQPLLLILYVFLRTILVHSWSYQNVGICDVIDAVALHFFLA